MRDYYIASDRVLDVLTPKVPKMDIPYGDTETARLVFSITIKGAINIFYDGEDDETMTLVQVYKLPPDVVPFTPSIQQAPLTPITQEVWVMQSVTPIYIGKALVTDGKQIEIPYRGLTQKDYLLHRWTYSFTTSDSFLERNLFSQTLSPPMKLLDFSPFKELIRSNSSSRASALLSFTIPEIEDGVVRSRMGDLGGTRLDDVSGHICYFSTESFAHPPLRWMQVISFEDLMPEKLKNVSKDNAIQVITDGIFKGDIRLTCNDPSFSFQGYHYIATQLDYNYQVPENRPPVKKNPKMEGTICKHLFSCFNWIRDNTTELVQIFYDRNAHLFSTPVSPRDISPKELQFDENLFPEYFK